MNDKSKCTVTEAVAASREETELEALVEVLGEGQAQAAVSKHVLPELVEATQRGYWKM